MSISNPCFYNTNEITKYLGSSKQYSKFFCLTNKYKGGCYKHSSLSSAVIEAKSLLELPYMVHEIVSIYKVDLQGKVTLVKQLKYELKEVNYEEC